ncbi:MAG: transport-associated protein [Deltaproteobacteria bacterium]|nr:transport-associated protein [Deltaproteobacteria bacterium]MBW2361294.1 transport-associated protein [Deltaproteobacteria bacterium]
MWIAIAIVAAVFGGGVGCKEEGPAEKLGRQLDDAAQNAGDAIENATEEAKKKRE